MKYTYNIKAKRPTLDQIFSLENLIRKEKEGKRRLYSVPKRRKSI